MTRVNKVIALFLILVTVLTVLLWNFLQSEYFASFISLKIEKSIRQQLNSEIKFNKLKFNLIPLGVSLQNVDFISKDIKKLPIITMRSVLLRFSLSDLFFNKISIEEILLDSGRIDFPVDLHSETDFQIKTFLRQIGQEEIKADKNIANIFNEKINEFLPLNIKHVELRNIYFNLDDIKFYLSSIKIDLSKNQKRFLINAESIKVPFLKKDNANAVDQLSLELDFNFINQQLKIKNIELIKDFNNIKADIQIDFNKKHIIASSLQGSSRIFIDIAQFASELSVQKYLHAQNGLLAMDLDIKGSITQPLVKSRLKISNLDIDYLKAENIEAELSSTNHNSIDLTNLKVWQDNEEAVLKAPIPLFDFKTKTLLPKEVKLIASNIKVQTALHVIKGIIEPLSGELSGEVGVTYKDMGLTINVLNPVNIDNLSLDLGKEKKLHILDVKKSTLKNAKFFVDLNKTFVSLDLSLKIKDTDFSAKGEINKNGLDIKTYKSHVNLEELGEKIAGVYFKGKGDLGIHVHGKFDKKQIKFDFKGDLIEGNILKFALGRVKTNFVLDLEKMILSIRPSEGNYKATQYFVEGAINFNSKNLDIDVNAPSASYEDLREMFSVLLVEAEKIAPKSIEGFVSVDASIRGGLNIKDLDVRGAFSGSELSINNEDFSSLIGDVRFFKNQIKIDNILLKKESGHISGFFHKTLGSLKYEYKFLLSNIMLSKISFYNRLGLGLKGKVNGYIHANKDDTLSGNGNIALTNASINDVKIADSRFQMKAADSIVQLNVDVMDKVLTLKSELNLKSKNEKNSYLDFNIQTSDFNLIAAIISPHNITDTTIKGNINCSFNSTFDISDLRGMDLKFNIDDFYFMKNNFSLGLYKGKSLVLVENGLIKNWDLEFEGEGGFFRSQGSGHLKHKFNLRNYFNFDAGTLEILTGKVVSSAGKIENKLTIVSDDSKLLYSAESVANNFSLVYAGLPGNFEDVESKITFSNGTVFIDKFKGKFASGNFNGNGKIFFDKKFPLLDLNFLFENANISYFKRSNVMVSGKGVLEGKAPPYNLKGDISIASALIQDEFDDMKKNQYGGKKIDNKYIPKIKKKESKTDLFDLDLNINPINNFYIKNSLIELGLNGKIRLLGYMSAPKLSGSLSLIPNSGKVFFKNNDFLLTRGNLFFYAEDESIAPELNFEGNSRISNYDVIFNLTGKTDSFNLELSSNPSLPQKDILSLLALGFTDDVSKNLNASDRMALTQAGMGSLILNRLKLDEGLKSSLGVNLSLSPEITENGAGDTSSTSVEGSKLRSATKLQVQKKLNKRTELTGSTTVSGTVNKKAMNLNYSINKRTSLEGLYEQTTINTGDVQENKNNSFGGGFKFKWTFK